MLWDRKGMSSDYGLNVTCSPQVPSSQLLRSHFMWEWWPVLPALLPNLPQCEKHPISSQNKATGPRWHAFTSMMPLTLCDRINSSSLSGFCKVFRLICEESHIPKHWMGNVLFPLYMASGWEAPWKHSQCPRYCIPSGNYNVQIDFVEVNIFLVLVLCSYGSPHYFNQVPNYETHNLCVKIVSNLTLWSKAWKTLSSLLLIYQSDWALTTE